MASFSITPGMGQGDIVGAINYLLANIGQGFQVDLIRGTVNIPNGTTAITNVYQLAYRYAEIAFADDQYGNGFDYMPEGKTYWGFRSIYLPDGATYIGVPYGPATKYNWQPISSAYLPITADTSLYYNVIAPYQISTDVYFAPSESEPTPGYREWYPGLDSQLIDTFNYSAPATSTIYDSGITSFIPTTYKLAVGKQNAFSLNPYRPYDISFPSDLTYTSSSTVAHDLLTVPNIQSNSLVNITPQSSAPTNATTGSIAVADRTSWDPDGLSTGTSYPVFYNGSQWVQMTNQSFYAQFQSNSTQTIAVSTASYTMTLNQTDVANGISQVDGVITLDGPGAYNLQWSGQFANSNSADMDAYIWLRQNGVDVPGSSGVVTVPGKHGSISGAIIASWNYFITTTSTNETVSLRWGAESTSVSMPYLGAGTNPTRPSVASLIVTVEKISV